MNLYFSGIGGVGLGPLAEIALDTGHHVQGSTLEPSPMTARLAKRGVQVRIGPQDGSFLRQCHTTRPVDCLIYTAALPPHHPELLCAKELGIRTAKRDALLATIIEQQRGLKLIAISGTHGKTTATGMAVWAMKRLGIPVSYSIGAAVPFGPSGQLDPASRYFVYECDEFDRNFLHFSPHVSLITSVDYDHPDTYPTETEYSDAFRQFVARSSRTILWKADAHTLAPLPAASIEVLKTDQVLQISLPGRHNRQNASLVARALEHLGIGTPAGVVRALDEFPGTARRLEKVAENLYSDYGHHPAEIAATLRGARELSDRVVLVYQPHQNVRQHHVRKDYRGQFDLAEETYWLPTYLAREDPSLPILGFGQLTAHIPNKTAVRPAELGEELWDAIQRARQEGKLVLAMGAGSIDAWLRDRLCQSAAPAGGPELIPPQPPRHHASVAGSCGLHMKSMDYLIV